jgi:hypothetical protein
MMVEVKSVAVELRFAKVIVALTMPPTTPVVGKAIVVLTSVNTGCG